MIGLSRDGRQLSLYKDWHLVHYLMTGKSWEPASSPLEMAILGGEQIPDVQGIMGYGPVRYLTPAQVREVAVALPRAPFAENLAKLDPAVTKAAKVYPPRFPPNPFGEDQKQSLAEYSNLTGKRQAREMQSCCGLFEPAVFAASFVPFAGKSPFQSV